MTEQTCNDAIEILRATQDGENLAPEHLYLVECAVNDRLNERGLQAFAELLANIRRGGYVKPWLQGVEHLTRNHAGFVFWKGQEVEHWDASLAYAERGKPAAEEIARRCRALEAAGVTLDTGNVVWRWREIAARIGVPAEVAS